ncbi:hypothetical protein CAEBREN_22036 [Caenorhabditis brenneri]|uniref:Uncharacterized protein n=1 Tax=Caenorhabditis brenneri TaxID=135651 RepID=G0MF39_CAEBE|nr:hypothetical protein CAEBREN_22036 [Caenorhabditis brenneri]
MYQVISSRKSKKVLFRFLVFVVLFQIIFILFIYEGGERVEESAFHEHDSTNNYMNVCSLPVYDYWHPKVMRYVDYTFDTTKNCDKGFKPYTELRNGEWRIVEEKKGMNCSARCFERLDNWNLKFFSWTPPGPVSCEFLEAVCWEDGKEIYGYIHTQIIPKKPKTEPKTKNPPNVFVFLLDSLSTGSAKRSLPKTLETLNRRLEAVEFPFVNKVGENSLPNGIALWFGKLIEKINGENYGGRNIEADWSRSQYCNTFLNYSMMEEFRDHGYMTLYSDDLEIQVLNHPHCQGLKDAPTDHYMHPFYLNYYKYGKEITRKHLEGHLCREHRHPAFEYFQEFLDVYKDKPKFTWTWLTTVGHDLFNGFLRADQELVEIIERNMEVYQPESGFTDTTTLSISNEKGHSYLRRQPSFPRTCGHLPIPPEYCICQVEKTVVTDENLRWRFGNLLIDHINYLIRNAGFSSLCEKYELKKVISLKHHGHLHHSESSHNYEIIVMTTAPIYAQFQTILMHNMKNNEVKFGNVMRMDRYGKTGDCTRSDQFQKMCFCRNLSFRDKMEYLMVLKESSEYCTSSIAEHDLKGVFSHFRAIAKPWKPFSTSKLPSLFFNPPATSVTFLAPIRCL